MHHYIFAILISLFSYHSLSSQTVFSTDEVIRMELDFYSNNWEKQLKSFRKNGLDARLPAKLKINETSIDSVGVRFKGNSSYNSPSKKENKKLPFNIDINEYNAQAILADGTKKIKLNNSFRDPTYMREVLAYEIISNYLPTPKVGYFNVIVNGQNYGIYVGVEGVNKTFTKEKYNYKKGTLIKCDPDLNAIMDPNCPTSKLSSLTTLGKNELCYAARYELKEGTWEPFVKFIDQLNHPKPSIEKNAAITEILWMHALNNVLVNLDSYLGGFGHNYYLYQDKFGIWRPIIWDLNLAFGGFPFASMTAGKLSNSDLIQLDPFLGAENPSRPLISVLLKNDTYRNIYTRQLQTILQDHFLNDKYKSRIQHFDKILSPFLQSSGKHLYDYQAFKSNQKTSVSLGNVEMIGLEQIMEARKAFLTDAVFSDGIDKNPLSNWTLSAPDTTTVVPPEAIFQDSLALVAFRDSVSKLDRNWNLSIDGPGLDKVTVFVQFEANGAFKSYSMTAKDSRWNFSLDQEEMPIKFYFLGHNNEKSYLFPKNAGYYCLEREN